MATTYERPDAYTKHDAAFADVQGHVVLNGAKERVATIAFKRAKSGLRVTAFVHWLGEEMQIGHANGGGYDKHSASAAAAARKVHLPSRDPEAREQCLAFVNALIKGHDGAYSWNRELENAGFTVFQAV